MIVRSATALVLAGIVVATQWLWIGHDWMLPWQLLVLVGMTIGADEWGRLIGLRTNAPRLGYTAAALAIALILVYSGRIGFDPILALVWLAAATPGSDALELAGLDQTLLVAGSAVAIWMVLFVQLKYPLTQRRLAQSVWAIAGLWLLPVAAYALLLLPPVFVWVCLGAVALGDTAAYAFGRWLGATPLAPVLSPGKTWEGFAGAIGAGLVAAVLGMLWWQPPLAVAVYAVLALIGLIVWAALGDLFASQMKRAAGVKDSGQILPGHGGILDRLDSLLAAAPLALLLLMLLHRLA